MRKIALLTVLIFLLGSFGIRVLAQNTDLPLPGLTPDSSFYFLDTLGEKLGIFLTFSAEKKAEKALNYAEEKLAEAKSMAEKNKTKALERATQNYQGYLNIANEKVEELGIKGKDIEKLVNLIKEKTLNHQEILSGLLEKVPEQAREGIEKAIEASKKGHETATKAVSKVKEEREKPAKEEEVIDETADWQTYKNEEYGFEFKYPLEYYLKDQLEGEEKAVLLGDKEFPKPEIAPWYHAPISIEVTNHERNSARINNLTDKDTSIIKVGGEEATLIEGKYSSYPGTPTIYSMRIITIPSKNLTISIQESYAGEVSDWSEIIETTEKIISTFKFIEVEEAADWETYSYPGANFTFNYPKDWEIRKDSFYKDNPNPTIVVCKKEEPREIYRNCIQINMPQFFCENVTRIKGNWIGICTKDSEIIEVYKKLIDSFKVKTSQIADWKVYQNEKYRFEFRYPPQWYLHYPDDPKKKDESIFFLKSKEIPDIGATEWYAYGDQMIVWVSEMIGRGDKKLSKEEYIQENFSDEDGAVPIIDKKWVIINGIDMLRIERESAGAGFNNLQYLHFKDDKVYGIYLYPYEPDNPDFSQNCIDFEKLISTFRFIIF